MAAHCHRYCPMMYQFPTHGKESLEHESVEALRFLVTVQGIAHWTDGQDGGDEGH